MEAKQANLETIQRWRDEIQGYWVEMTSWERSEDIEGILRRLSAFHARAGYMRSLLVRSANKSVSDFRTKEVDHFLSSVEFQFKTWSRIGAVTQSEWSMSR